MRKGRKIRWKNGEETGKNVYGSVSKCKKTGGFYDIVRVGIHGKVRHMMEYFLWADLEIMFFDGICALFSG